MGKGRGKDDSDDGDSGAEPVWPKILAAVLAGIFALQLIAIIVIVTSGDDAAPAAAPAPPPAAPPPTPAPFVEGASAAGNGDAGTPPPAPPAAPPPPATLDRRLRVSQFVGVSNELSSVDQLDYFVTSSFEVTFGAGCSTVGGGVFCGEGTYALDAFKTIIRENLESGSNSQLIHTYGATGDDVAGTVTDHYRVGSSGAHGAIIYHFVGMQIDQIFFYADAGEKVRQVQGFYNVIDGCGSNVDACNEVSEMYRLNDYVTSNYLAVFGPGTAKVGGATHSANTNDLMDKDALKAFVVSAPARCSRAEVSGISCPPDLERTFITEGDTVVNHYTATNDDTGDVIHAVAVHEFVNGKIAESYWYTEHTSSDCSPPSHENTVIEFLERVDAHFLPATGDSRYVSFEALNFENFTHFDYQAVFGPGCVLIGRNQRCGPDEVQLDADELEEFVDGRGKLFPGGSDYVATCAQNMLTIVANNASVPACTRAWSADEIVSLSSCTSVYFSRFANVCLDNQIMSDGDTVVDTYEYKCGGGCTIGTLLPRGVVVHEFQGSKIAASYWYNN